MLSRLAAAAALLALAGCSGSEPAAPASAVPRAPATATDAAASCAPTGGELAFGEVATVDYPTDGGTAPLEVTVTGVEEGDRAAVDELDLPAVGEGTPFYLQATVTNVGEEPLQFADPAAALMGLDDRCRQVAPLAIPTRFEDCDYVTAPEGYAPGESFETCVTYLVTDGAALIGSQYGDASPPVVWRQ